MHLTRFVLMCCVEMAEIRFDLKEMTNWRNWVELKVNQREFFIALRLESNPITTPVHLS